MKEIVCPLEKFKFKEFVNDMNTFAEEVIDPDYVTAWVEELGEVPEYEPASDENTLLEMIREERKILYFGFSGTNIGEPIPCADGNEYELDEDSDFCIGATDSVGYAVQYLDGNLVINSAVNAGGACTAPPPSLDLEPDCDTFDKPMEVFISKYVKK